MGQAMHLQARAAYPFGVTGPTSIECPGLSRPQVEAELRCLEAAFAQTSFVMLPPDVEEQVDDAYAAPLDEFTARRNELAKTLRADGRRDEADEVKSLAKPTLPAWVVNQLARRDRRDVDLLLDAGHRLRRTQGGGGVSRDQLDDAVRAERAALQRLLPAARRILAERGTASSSAVLERVSRTLRAASASDEGRELLARGRLTSELEAPGFELLAGLAPQPASGERRAARKEQGEKANRREELKAARERVDAAAATARDVKKGLVAAERELAAARREADRLEEQAAALRAELDAAEKAQEAARDELERLQRRRR